MVRSPGKGWSTDATPEPRETGYGARFCRTHDFPHRLRGRWWRRRHSYASDNKPRWIADADGNAFPNAVAQSLSIPVTQSFAVADAEQLADSKTESLAVSVAVTITDDVAVSIAVTHSAAEQCNNRRLRRGKRATHVRQYRQQSRFTSFG